MTENLNLKRLPSLQAVKGMNDVLPPESQRWEWLENQVRVVMTRYGYANIRTPVVEPTALFVRGLGEVTDVVEKEMYSFEDALNGDRLSLRPENTAGVVRAVNEHHFLRDGGKRVFYIGPMFRHERPQKGRYRQFHQVGAEALGFAGPDIDAELILMCRALWRDLGLTEGRDLHLEINSLGQPDERQQHRAALIQHFEQHVDTLDEDAKRRLHSNPLRILDTKNPDMQAVVASAPQLIQFLGEASLAHLNALRLLLDESGVAYRINPRLVRGLDYYNLTVFEWVTDRLGSQGTVCAGGRYDLLIERLGGNAMPAVGWGLGIERLLLLLDSCGVQSPARCPDVFAVVPGEQAVKVALRACETLRSAGLNVVMHVAGSESWGSVKSQFKRADASGAQFAFIFGDDELACGEVSVKPLKDPTALQVRLSLDHVLAWAQALLPA
jgi:histidyl-tRNA synthetase